MRQSLIIPVLLVLAAATARAQQPYVKTADIPIGGAGSWDYVAVDPDAKRLYVSHGTEVVVVDTAKNAVIGKVPAGPGVHGIAISPALKRIYISNGRGANPDGSTGNVSIVDATTLQKIASVPTGLNPDAILYEPTGKDVYAFNHTGKSVTVFDARDGRVIATIPLSGELEEAVEDPAANRMYVNIEDKGAIGVMDTVTHMVVAEWAMPGCDAPTGMAFDQKNNLILSACEGRMAVIDSRTGKEVTTFATADAVDGNGFDAATGYAFASSRTGVLTVAHEDAPGKFTVVQTLQTQPSGRTMALDPVTHHVYVPVASTTPGPNGRAQIAPNTMKVLVFGLR